MGKRAHKKIKLLMTVRRIPIEMRKRFAKQFIGVWFLFGNEPWTTTKKEERYRREI